jgi:hypothetical protein
MGIAALSDRNLEVDLATNRLVAITLQHADPSRWMSGHSVPTGEVLRQKSG